MLKKIRLTDFKSFVDEEVELAPLTLLVGANASGKSNFLDAIRVLHGFSYDMDLSELLNSADHKHAWPGIRGRAVEASRYGTQSFAIESTWLVPHSDVLDTPAYPLLKIKHRVTCQTAPHLRLASESLIDERTQRLLFSTGPSTDQGIAVPWTDRSKRPVFLPNDRSVIHSILSSITPQSPIVPTEIVNLSLSLWEGFGALRFLSIRPVLMRDYGRREYPLGNEGQNFSGVLADICSDPAMRQSLIDWLREICAPELEKLDFAGVEELGDVVAIFVEKSGARISARSISDGTLRFLGLLLALRTAEAGTIYLIEDIEEGLHPTRIRLLVEFLQAVVHERGIQVIATTHSPTVLQWLSPETLRDVIVFGRVTDHEGTLMRRLGDLPHFNEVVQRKGIEELFSTGWLEMAL